MPQVGYDIAPSAPGGSLQQVVPGAWHLSGGGILQFAVRWGNERTDCDFICSAALLIDSAWHLVAFSSWDGDSLLLVSDGGPVTAGLASVERPAGANFVNVEVDLGGFDVQRAVLLIATDDSFGGLVTFAADGALQQAVMSSWLGEDVPMMPVLVDAGGAYMCSVYAEDSDSSVLQINASPAQDWTLAQPWQAVMLCNEVAAEQSMEVAATWLSQFRLGLPDGIDYVTLGAIYDWGVPVRYNNLD